MQISIPLFDGLDAPAKQAILHKLNIRTHAARENIIHAQDRSTDVFFILSGCVSVKIFADSGQEVTYSEIGAGSFFGEFSAIDGNERSADVSAVTDVRIGRMPAGVFKQILLAHPEIALRFAEHLVAKIRALSGRVFEYSVFPVPVRVRRALLKFADKVPVVDGSRLIKPAPTHYEIATLTSTHREAVSRELSHLAALGVISTGRQAIRILDMARLHALAAQS